MVNELGAHLENAELQKNTDSAEQSPSLIRGDLLSNIGGTARIYDARWGDESVVIKEARDPSRIPLIQSEYEFISKNSDVIKTPFSDYGIPVDWQVQTRFVRPIHKAVTPEMLKAGQIVMEKVSGLPLIDESTSQANMAVPVKFHFAALAGWSEMLKRLTEKGLAMDTNIDTDLLLYPNPITRVLNVVRIDCTPIPGGARGQSTSLSPDSSFWFRYNNGSQNLTNEQSVVKQTIDSISLLWPSANFSGIISPAIQALRGRFQEGMINDTDTFNGFLKRAVQKIDWEHDFIKSGDQRRLQKWRDATF